MSEQAFTTVQTIDDNRLLADPSLCTGNISCSYNHLGTGNRLYTVESFTDGQVGTTEYNVQPDQTLVCLLWKWDGGAVRCKADELATYQMLAGCRSPGAPADAPGLFPFRFRVVGIIAASRMDGVPIPESQYFIIVQEKGNDAPESQPQPAI